MAKGYSVPMLGEAPEDWEQRHDICFSGGAIGADYYWSWKAERMGHRVRAYSFPGHQFTGPARWRQDVALENLQEIMPKVKLAGIKLNKSGALSANWYVRALLCRNYFQIKDVERVYAIGYIKPNGVVDGGTSWALQMFIDRFQGESCPCHIWDLERKWWYRWDGREWSACISLPPRPEGHYAGIGTRKFNDWGRKAIDQLWAQ